MNGSWRRSSSGWRAKRKGRLALGAVRLLVRGESARADLLGIGRRSLSDPPRQIVIALHEPRRELEHSKHVVGHQHLPVTVVRGAHADDRHGEIARDVGGEAFHHALDDDAEGARLSDGMRVAVDLFGLLLGLPTRAVAAEDVYRLRGE